MNKQLVKTTKREIRSLDKDLTFKQRAFLKRYFETGNGTKSAMEVYDCKDYGSASVVATETLAKLRNPVKAFLESKGIGLGTLAITLSQGLKAKKVVGIPNDFIETEDHATRHKYMETAAKWLGVEGDASDTADNIKRRIVAEEYFEK